MGLRESGIVDSDNKSYFICVKWLNLQSGRAYIRARAVDKEVGNSIVVNFRDKQQAQARTIRKFGPRE